MRLLCLCLWLFCLPCWGAIVPDGSVVHSEEEAPRLPADPNPVRTPLPAPSKIKPKTPKAAPTPTVRPVSRPDSNTGGAFSGTASGDTANPGESRPLVPLMPVAAPTASNMPQWAALGVFLLLAVGGMLLSQQRDQE